MQTQFCFKTLTKWWKLPLLPKVFVLRFQYTGAWASCTFIWQECSCTLMLLFWIWYHYLNFSKDWCLYWILLQENYVSQVNIFVVIHTFSIHITHMQVRNYSWANSSWVSLSLSLSLHINIPTLYSLKQNVHMFKNATSDCGGFKRIFTMRETQGEQCVPPHSEPEVSTQRSMTWACSCRCCWRMNSLASRICMCYIYIFVYVCTYIYLYMLYIYV